MQRSPQPHSRPNRPLKAEARATVQGLQRTTKTLRACASAACISVAALLLTGCATERLRRIPVSAGFTRDYAETLARRTEAPLTESNRVITLVNGNEFFPAMLREIRRATNSITFENFIWRSGALSDHFIEAITERAHAGVDIRILLDSFGTIELANKDERELRDSGVQFVKYNRLWKFWNWNHRTHRKLMVVDGRVGFIGGICIGDNWMGNAERVPLWRDTHYQVEGPVVAQMQNAIQTNWFEMTGQRFEGARFYPALQPKGTALASCFVSGPREGRHNAQLSYLAAIRSARKSIRMEHSYFVPDRTSIEALLDARRRGVKVEIITPGVIDANVVRRASRSRWRKLLEAGVEFYEYQGAAFHCKLLIVDDTWVNLGSVNFDDRSFHINDEANLQVFDANVAADQIAMFETDKRRTIRVTLDSYNRRSIWIKGVENFYGLFRKLL